MDDPTQVRAYAEADFSAPHDRFVELFRQSFPGLSLAGAEVLDLGCGPADVSIRFARAFHGCRITGLDAGANMLAAARRVVAEAGLSSRIDFIEARLPAMPVARHSCDAVISNSLLHHLADPSAIWRAIGHCAKPGAPVWVMDLMRPSDETVLNELVARYAGGEPAVLQQDFRNSLKSSYRVDEVKGQLVEAGMSVLRVEAVSDRHWIAFCGAGQV